jgi:NADPH:quinone reductase
MRAVTIQTFGGPEGLAVTDLPDPAPAPGEVLITTEAIGVGGVDALIRGGTLRSYGFTEGHIPGSEVAGTVAEVGAGVEPSWVGRRVWAFTGVGGGYATKAVASVDAVVPLPEAMSPADAVTLGSSAPVAELALRHVHFAPGESVLVRGASGGLGVMAVQLAARGGASTVAVTTSSSARGERLRALGATDVLDRAGNGGDGYDVIVDIVAGPDMPSFFAKLATGGRMVAVGIMGGPPPADFGMALFGAFQKSLSFAMFSANPETVPDRWALTGELFAAAVRGELRAVVHEVLGLDKAVLAHQKMAAGEVFGRLVLTPSTG